MPSAPADNDVEALTLELIQLMTLLLKHVPTALLGPHRKALLHTSWRWVQVGSRLGWGRLLPVPRVPLGPAAGSRQQRQQPSSTSRSPVCLPTDSPP